MNHKDLPIRERPAHRASYQPEGCSIIELLAAVIGGPTQLEAAANLITTFGTLDAMRRASPEELAAVDNMGKAKAANVKAALEMGARLADQRNGDAPAIQSPEDAYNLLAHKAMNAEQESFWVILLNTRNKVIGDPIELYKQTLNSASIRTAEVFKRAVRSNACAIIVAHNHPSGDPAPSPEDVSITRNLVEAGELLGIPVLDHIIIGHGHFVSLKAKGLGF